MYKQKLINHNNIGDYMLYQYEIKNNILYLYLSMKYEFSKELINSDNNLENRTLNFIQSNKIPFKGNKVYLIVDGITVKSININNKNQTLTDNKYSNDTYMITIKDNNTFYEITLKEYLIGVLLAFYQDKLHEEVLKALSIMFRTYAYKEMDDNKFIQAANQFHNFKPPVDYQDSIKDYESVKNKLELIVKETDAMFLSYQANYILPFYHEVSSGRTLSNKEYPYLSSVKSLWDLASDNYITYQDFSYEELKRNNIIINNNTSISISITNNKKYIQFNKDKILLTDFLKRLNIPSPDMSIIVYPNFLRIISKGKGSLLGLSLYASNELAKNNIKYYTILKYYFPKVKLFKYTKRPL